jgi:hypothetical protein
MLRATCGLMLVGLGWASPAAAVTEADVLRTLMKPTPAETKHPPTTAALADNVNFGATEHDLWLDCPDRTDPKPVPGAKGFTVSRTEVCGGGRGLAALVYFYQGRLVGYVVPLRPQIALGALQLRLRGNDGRIGPSSFFNGGWFETYTEVGNEVWFVVSAHRPSEGSSTMRVAKEQAATPPAQPAPDLEQFRWKGGPENGRGRAIGSDGSKYRGEFKDGKLHGQGTLTMPGGGAYVGEFKGGEFVKGTWTEVGGTFVGEFKDGVPAHGTFSYPGGATLSIPGAETAPPSSDPDLPSWPSDTPTAAIPARRPSAPPVAGKAAAGPLDDVDRMADLADLVPERPGRQAPAPRVYAGIGEYVGAVGADGLPEGEGRMAYSGGGSYAGSWHAGQWHGAGTLVRPDGQIVRGTFERGHLVKGETFTRRRD